MIEPGRLLPLRHAFNRAVRGFFDARGFIEVETPVAVTSPGMEPHLRAFVATSVEAPETHRRLYLHTSPEYHMKRALARYGAPIYQLCKCFRDEPASRLHHPEFTMLEWYRPEADYRSLMDDCDGLLAHLGQELLDGEPLRRPGAGEPRGTDSPARDEHRVRLDLGCRRRTVSEVFVETVGFDPLALTEAAELRAAARAAGLAVADHWSWEDVFHFALIDQIEEGLGDQRPEIVAEYPPRLAALSRVVSGRAERFELYVDGHELANAFSELVDPDEQRRRFIAEQRERESLGRPVYPIDEALLDALAELPPSAGIALGLDRLFLLFAEHAIGRQLDLTDALWTSL